MEFLEIVGAVILAIIIIILVIIFVGFIGLLIGCFFGNNEKKPIKIKEKDPITGETVYHEYDADSLILEHKDPVTRETTYTVYDADFFKEDSKMGRRQEDERFEMDMHLKQKYQEEEIKKQNKRIQEMEREQRKKSQEFVPNVAKCNVCINRKSCARTFCTFRIDRPENLK